VRNLFIPFSFCFILLGFSNSFANDSYTQLQSGYRDGFFMKTEDDRFGLKVGTRLNFGYTYGFVDPAENLSSFDIQHAKFYMGGNAFGQIVQYYVQAAAANNTRTIGLGRISESTNQGFILEDYYVRLQYEGMDIKLGQYKVPFGRQWMIYSGNLQFVQRSVPAQAFLLGRDRGITLNRYKDTWSVSMGVFNGAGQIQTPNPFVLQTGQNQSNDAGQTGMLYVSRVTVSPMGPIGYSEGDVEQTQSGLFELGGSFAYDQHRDYDLNFDQITDDTNLSTISAAGDLTWKREGASLQGEFFYRRHMSAITPDFTSMGWYVQTGYFLVPRKIEAALRFSWLDSNRLIPANNMMEGAAVLNYYFSGDHRFKSQLQYTWLGLDAGGTRNDDGYIDLSLQVTL
jgi:phosphate-selective porin OprO/OprP